MLTTPARTSPPPRRPVLEAILLVSLAASLTTGCGGSPAPALPDVSSYQDLAREIVDTALQDGQAYEKLVELCETAPSRLAGSEGARRAVEWGREVMQRDGLDNIRTESVLVPHWRRGDTERLTLVEPDHRQGEFRILALGGSIATPEGGIEAPVVEVTSFEELEAMDGGASGKIVFFNRPMDPKQTNTFRAYGGAVNQRSQGAIEAAKAGAVAAIVRSMTTLLDDAPHTGAMRYSDDVRRVPAAAISTLGAERLSRLIADEGRVVLRLELSCETLADTDSHNVVGEIIGHEFPDEIVVVGGHLDAWDVGCGAHDDGAGICHSLEAMRLLRLVGFQPRRTIRCVLFMNEENGVRGGNAYYESHLADMGDHVFALESDRGGFVPRGFSTDANEEALAILRRIGALLGSIGADKVQPGGGGVDIGPMTKSGVVTMGLLPDSQRYFDVHHSENDVIAAVNERELELGAAAVATMIAVVADLPERIPANPPRQ